MLLNFIFSNVLTHSTYIELLPLTSGWETVVGMLMRGS